jgi:hypothetical protein
MLRYAIGTSVNRAALKILDCVELVMDLMANT